MAVSCFTAPVMIYLLFVSAKGVAFLMKKRNGILRQIAEINQAALSVTEMDRLVEMDKTYKKKIDQLNSRRQLPAIYLPFLSAVGIVMLYILVKDQSWLVPMEVVAYVLIIFSVAAFLDGVHRIYRVTVAAIETQRLLEADTAAANPE
jgi:hypothetical protein